MVNYKKVKTGKRHVCICKKWITYCYYRFNGKIDGATDEVLPMGSIRAKFELLIGTWLTYSRNDIKLLLQEWQMQNQERKRKTSLCYLHEMGMGWFHDEHSCLAWKSTKWWTTKMHWLKTITWRSIRLLRLKIAVTDFLQDFCNPNF
jgi:hypothetical protein